ncbi:MAG: hypothetical protein HRT47_05990 [Candidatus Caenarcaniphilales bacterium]|nr:hypothetical protein [Candidatus Caenarcaniphilales bacterium]
MQTPLNSENSRDLGLNEFLIKETRAFHSEVKKRDLKRKDSQTNQRETGKSLGKENLLSTKKLRQLHQIFSKISGPLKFTSLEQNPLGIPLYYAQGDNDLHLLYPVTSSGEDLDESSARKLANHIIRKKSSLPSIKMIEIKADKLEQELKNPSLHGLTKLKDTRNFPIEIIMGKLFRKFRPVFKTQEKKPFSTKLLYEIDSGKLNPKVKSKKNNPPNIIVHSSTNPNFNVLKESLEEGASKKDIHIRITPPKHKAGFSSSPKYNSIKSKKNNDTRKQHLEILLEDKDRSEAKIEIIGKKTVLQKLINTSEIKDEIERTLSHKSGRAGEQIIKQLFKVLGANVTDKTRGPHPYDLEIERGEISSKLWEILSPNNQNLALEIKSSKNQSPSISYFTIHQLSYFTDNVNGKNAQETEPIVVKVNLGNDFPLEELATIFEKYPPKIVQKENSIVIKPNPGKSKIKDSPYQKIVLMNFNKLKEKAHIEVSEVNLSTSAKEVKSSLLNKLNWWLRSNGKNSSNLNEIFKQIENDLDLSIASVAELDKYIKDPQTPFKDQNLLFKLRQHILQNHLVQNFKTNIISSLSNAYNINPENKQLIDFIPVSDQKLDQLENKIWAVRKQKGLSFSDKQKELEKLEGSARGQIQRYIEKYFKTRSNSPWDLRKIPNEHITLKHTLTNQVKYLEILPFSYTLKELKYPADKINNPNITITKPSKEIVASNKLIAFYNKYDRGIYVIEAEVPSKFKQDLKDLIQDPTKYKKAIFKEGPFSVQAKNTRIRRKQLEDGFTINDKVEEEIQLLIEKYKQNPYVQDLALDKFYETRSSEIDDEFEYFEVLLNKIAKSKAIKDYYDSYDEII